jgi:hypothetical protein
VAHALAGLVEASADVRYRAISTDVERAAAEKAALQLSKAAKGLASVVYDDGAQWAERYRVVTVPTIIVLDADGTELGRYIGHLNAADLNGIALLLSNSKALDRWMLIQRIEGDVAGSEGRVSELFSRL